jgi:hypothetical protein
VANEYVLKEHRGSLVLVQYLSFLTLFPLLLSFYETGSFRLEYLHATRMGLLMSRCLGYLRILRGKPTQLDNLFLLDTEYASYAQSLYKVHAACRRNYPEIASTVGDINFAHSDYFNAIFAVNIVKSWADRLIEFVALCNCIQYLGKCRGLSSENLIVIARDKSLYRQLEPEAIFPGVTTRSDLSFAGLWRFIAMWLLIASQPLRKAFKGRDKSAGYSDADIGVAAVWGADLERKNDFFWLADSQVHPSRLLYLFDRIDLQFSYEKARAAYDAVGVESRPLFTYAAEEGSQKVLAKGVSGYGEIYRHARLVFFIVLRLAVHGQLGRFVLYQILQQYTYSIFSGIMSTYKALKLRMILHYQESGADYVMLAAENAQTIRLGYHWSSLIGPTPELIRPHHVFFTWGIHDARIYRDNGSISPYMIIGGSPMHEMSSNEIYRKAASEASEDIRQCGSSYVLALFDNSLPTPAFYKFFLTWLVEDPECGLLIKSKGIEWFRLQHELLGDLARQAEDTGRIRVLDWQSSPADAALAADFSVGIGTPSATIVAALEDARVLYLDYEKLDHGPLAPYTTLHSLGAGRCVFYDVESLQDAVRGFIGDSTANPHLGDISPVIDQFDPFRDGKASQRIGEYVGWFNSAMDAGARCDRALVEATRRYADKWGHDKIVRGL